MAEDMAAMGFDPERIEAFRDRSLCDDEDEVVKVWPENADAVNVFVRCDWERQAISDGHTSRLLPVGINGAEIRNVAELLAVPRDRWPRLLDDVRRMVSTVLPALQRG